MKIIDIAICVNNKDPKGIGRIRCVRYNDYVSQKEKALEYETWSDRDSFVASPFLPTNINLIPKKGQAVKIINYSTDKEAVNQEYIPGPFSTMYDFNSQNYTQQIENTTYGVYTEHKKDIIDGFGKPISPNTKSTTENAFATEDDFAIYGKFGSDVIFTENGLQLRGGKLVSKENLTPNQKIDLISWPLMGKKTATLYLKKFAKKKSLITTRIVEKTLDVLDLKSVVEYEVDDLTSPTTISFFVYKVTNPYYYGAHFKTNTFGENSTLITEAIKLINTDNTTTTPTFTASVDDYDSIARIIRDKLNTIHEDGLNKISPILSGEDLHPFFFRPSEKFKILSGDKSSIVKKVKVINSGPGSGLVWSKSQIKPQEREIVRYEKKLDEPANTSEQTFAAVKSDKIYLLSTDTNEGNPPCNTCNNTINFGALNSYELTQKDYIEEIEPNTYATVRGENLLRVLRQMVQVIFTHSHNINKSIESQPDYAAGQILLEMIKTLETDLLNKSIRVN